MKSWGGLGSLLVWTFLARVGLARVCPSMDIRNSASRLQLLEDCHRIQGFLQVVLIENAKEADFANMTFPKLREVSAFVIFYRVHGLTSIGRLFPNLSVIGGDDLVKDYALIISQMHDLKEIDLYQLRVILRGSVAVVKNPSYRIPKLIQIRLKNGSQQVEGMICREETGNRYIQIIKFLKDFSVLKRLSLEIPIMYLLFLLMIKCKFK